MENNTGFEERQTEGFSEAAAIGLNSSAEILSKLLNSETVFTASSLNQERIKGLKSFGDEPGIAVSLSISGAIEGKAAAVVKSTNIRDVINVLMSLDEGGGTESEELDEIAVGTFRELVGQMAAAYAESITDFLGAAVKIESGSTDEISEDCDEVAEFLGCSVNDEAYSMAVDFSIGGSMNDTFVIVLSDAAMESTLRRIIGEGDEYSEEGNYDSFANMPNIGNAINAAKQLSHTTTVVKDGGINVQSASFPSFAGTPNGSSIPLLNGNIDLLMDVPLNVTIEIGKTRKKMREIMEFAQGTIIDLEKQAGAPVDVVVNGQLIARGDVVVIDDNFGVRITEIVGGIQPAGE